MPTYIFRDKTTDQYHEEFMGINELDKYLLDNPNLEQAMSAPSIVSGVSGKKPDQGFRDILRNIKKEHSRGITRSTVNTF